MPFRIIDVTVAGAIYFSPSRRQNRYKSIVCDEDAYFTELVRYIHLNPLRAKLVKSLAQLDRYRWSTPPFN